jgi:hypothetical protein
MATISAAVAITATGHAPALSVAGTIVRPGQMVAQIYPSAAPALPAVPRQSLTYDGDLNQTGTSAEMAQYTRDRSTQPTQTSQLSYRTDLAGPHQPETVNLALNRNVYPGQQIPGQVAGMRYGCGMCPDLVLGTIAQDVTRTLDRVRRLKSIVNAMNAFLSENVEVVLSAVRAFASSIPVPPLLDVREIVKILSCPLTPQAVIIEKYGVMMSRAVAAANSKGLTLATPIPRWSAMFQAMSTSATDDMTQIMSKLDVRRFKHNCVEAWKSYARKVEEDWKRFLDQLDETYGGFARAWNRLVKQILSVFGDIDVAAVSIAVTTASVSLVRATCPSVYARSDLPFATYAAEISDFSFDGLCPSGLNAYARAAVEAFMQVYIKLSAWATAPLILL